MSNQVYGQDMFNPKVPAFSTPHLIAGYLDGWRMSIIRKEEMSDYDRLLVTELTGRIAALTGLCRP